MQFVPVLNISIIGQTQFLTSQKLLKSTLILDSIINNMKSKSSTGYDNISNKLIKSAKDVVIKPLTLLMNHIIHTGEFQKQLKIVKVKHLFKGVINQVFPTIGLFHCCLPFLKFLSTS